MCEQDEQVRRLIENLRECSDGSSEDEDLLQLIEAVCQSPDKTPKQRRSIHRLLIKIQRLPGLLKSPHQDYGDALSRTFEWFYPNIKNFQPKNPSIARSLERWLNGYLKWRIRDLKSSDISYISIDKPIGIEEESGNPVTLGDLISKYGSNQPTIKRRRDVDIDGIEVLIKQLQAQKVQRVGLALESYIEQDPEGKLRNCHPKNYPDCNCQFLSQKFVLEEPHDKIVKVAKDLNINQQTLYAHWTRNCRVLLLSISIEIGYQTEKLQQYIEQDPQQRLQNCYLRKYSNCNCQFLAQRLLTIFKEPPDNLADVAQELEIDLPILKSYWEEKCLFLLSKIAIEQKYQPIQEP